MYYSIVVDVYILCYYMHVAGFLIYTLEHLEASVLSHGKLAKLRTAAP